MKEIIVRIQNTSLDNDGNLYGYDVISQDASFTAKIPYNAHTKLLLGGNKTAYYKMQVEDNGNFKLIHPRLKDQNF